MESFEEKHKRICDMYSGRSNREKSEAYFTFDKISRIVLLKRFGYNLDSYAIFDTVGNMDLDNKQSLYMLDLRLLQNTFENKKIDHGLKLIMYAGETTYTDEERSVIQLKADVFSYPKEQWLEKFYLYLTNYKHDFYVREYGNRTIFLMGIPFYITLYRVMFVVEKEESTWLNLLELTFDMKGFGRVENIDYEMIVMLHACRLTRNIFIKVLEKFNTLKVIGNLNQFPMYWEFLRKYIMELSNLGFVNTRNAINMKLNISADKEKKSLESAPNVKNKIDLLLATFDSLKREITSEINSKYCEGEHYKFEKEILLILDFLDKNEEIINCETVCQIEDPIKINTTFNSEFVNKIEYQRLLNLQQSVDEILKQANESVQAGKLFPSEYVELEKELSKRELR